MGLKEETVLPFLKHDNKVAKREPFRPQPWYIYFLQVYMLEIEVEQS